MNVATLRQELKHKERSLNDLTAYVGNRSETTPNYSLLIGAGASVTSGVRSGADLVNEWREHVCKKYGLNDIGGVDLQKSFLQQNCSAWYNPDREYSSLFEHRFDLPRQRRMFVEKQVSGPHVFPSIGYAYLVKLIENGFLNVVFTTNFDDLLNEAFYQFSTRRPIVCAHDSAIGSVTVTSSRPKIIKLHGDYLFDDIKSTLRETESLEANIRDKLVEFSKEYGLVVAGYSGGDRSIVDVLHYMLRTDSYLKNGLYWCIREDDDIGDELRKLLWKDRVFFVVIDGFDEGMAEIYSSLVGEELPINIGIYSKKSSDVTEIYPKNDYLISSKSKIIATHLEILRRERHTNAIADVWKDLALGGDKVENPGDDDEYLFLMQLSQLRRGRQFDEMISKIDAKLELNPRKSFRQSLLSYKAKAYESLGKKTEACAAYKKLADLKIKDPGPLWAQARCEITFDARLDLSKRAVARAPHLFSTHAHLGQLYWSASSCGNSAERQERRSLAMESYLKSLKCDSSLDNDVWLNVFDAIVDGEKCEEYPTEEAIIKEMSSRNPNNIKVTIAENSLAKKKKFTTLENETLFERAKRRLNSDVEGSEVEHANGCLKAAVICNSLSDFSTMFEDLLKDEDLEKRDSLKRLKAKIARTVFGDRTLEIKILQSIAGWEDKKDIVEAIFRAFLRNDEIDEAQEKLEHLKSIADIATVIVAESDLYDARGDYVSAVTSLFKLREITPFFEAVHAANIGYLYLAEGNFQKAHNFLDEFLKKRGYAFYLGTEMVNFEIARKGLGKSVNRGRLEGIKSQSREVKVASNYLLDGNQRNMLEGLKVLLEDDLSVAGIYNKWVLFNADDKEKIVKLTADIRQQREEKLTSLRAVIATE